MVGRHDDDVLHGGRICTLRELQSTPMGGQLRLASHAYQTADQCALVDGADGITMKTDTRGNAAAR